MIQSGKNIHVMGFSDKELDNLHACDALLKKGVDPGHGGPQFPEDIPGHGTEKQGDSENDGNQRDTDQRKPQVHVKHDPENADEDEKVLHQGHDNRFEHLIEILHVVCQAGDQTADGIPVKK